MNKNMIEIERKFLAKPSAVYENVSNYIEIVQGYIVKNEIGSVRVRIQTELGESPKAFIMSKTRIDDMTNHETVDEITVENAKKLIENFSFKVIEKSRCIRFVGDKKWEIDIFQRPNKGLILAEIELKSADEEIEIPEWVIEEVTCNEKYYNVNM